VVEVETNDEEVEVNLLEEEPTIDVVDLGEVHVQVSGVHHLEDGDKEDIAIQFPVSQNDAHVKENVLDVVGH
jgi:urease beta subunit